MANLRNLAVGTVLAGTVLYAALKGYVYLGVRDGLEKATLMARPFASISYGGISSDLGGSVSLDEVVIRPVNGTVPLRIGTLELSGPGPGFLLDLAGGFEPGQPPEWMELSLRAVELPHPLDMVPDLDWPTTAGIPGGDVPESCSLADLLKRAGVLQAEEFPLRLDAGLGYRVVPGGGELTTRFFYRIAGGDSVELELAMSGMPDPRMAMLGRMPAAQRISLAYIPDGDRVALEVAQCAADRGQSKELYVGGLAEGPARDFSRQFGFVPGPGLRHALQRFLLDPGEVLVTARPEETLFQVPPTGLTPEQLIPLLNLAVTVGGQPVDDLSFNLERPPRERATGPVVQGGATPSRSATVGAASTPAPPKRERLHFLATPVAELEDHLYRQVKVWTSRRDIPVEGTLVSLRDGQISVEQRIHGGKMTVHVPVTSITSAEVLRRKQAP